MKSTSVMTGSPGRDLIQPGAIVVAGENAPAVAEVASRWSLSVADECNRGPMSTWNPVTIFNTEAVARPAPRLGFATVCQRRAQDNPVLAQRWSMKIVGARQSSIARWPSHHLDMIFTQSASNRRRIRLLQYHHPVMVFGLAAVYRRHRPCEGPLPAASWRRCRPYRGDHS